MSLRAYSRSRLVVLNKNATVLEAARALENNEVGTIIVQEQGHVVGIVTDRDLTIRALSRELEPKATTLATVMTARPATLPADAAKIDAVRVMQERAVRRIPLVEDGRVAGIVTLDDLLLDESIPIEDIAGVIRSQIGEGGPVSPVRRAAREARAEASYRRLLNELRDLAHLESSEQAETALDICLAALLRRLIPGEAKDLLSQLPLHVQARMHGLPPGPDKSVTRDAIEAEIMKRLDLDLARAAETLLAVGQLLEEKVSPGQIEDTIGQLPEGLKKIFPSSHPQERAPLAAKAMKGADGGRGATSRDMHAPPV